VVDGPRVVGGPRPDPLRIGIVGGGFAGTLHAEGWQETGTAAVVAMAAPSAGTRAAFTARFGGTAYDDPLVMIAQEQLDAVSLAMPTVTHREVALAAIAAGVGVVCEKPLAMNLAQADEMITAARNRGVPLMYAEQIVFAPRYAKVRELLRAGAFGEVIQASHRERHGGPHAAWFRDPERSGGGVTLDMGIHGVGLLQWLLAPARVTHVYARITRTSADHGPLDDYCLLVLEFDTGVTATVDASWAAPGGVDDVLEVLGTAGYVRADLARGQTLDVYTLRGVDYAAEKVEAQTGWLKVAQEEARAWGWHGEFAHFAAVLRSGEPLVMGGEQGRDALAVVIAAYASAATNSRVALTDVVDCAVPAAPWLAAHDRHARTAGDDR